MIDRRKCLSAKSGYNAALPRCALLIRAIELLLSAFYKKTHPDKLNHFKKWEREKIANLGLADHSLESPHSSAKDISFTSWDYEKISNFGLTSPRLVKNIHRSQHQPKEKHLPIDFTPKISPAQAWKKVQNQSKTQRTANNDNSIDDFFKILGYE